MNMGNENIFWSGGFLYNPKAKSILLHKRDSKTKVNPNKWAFFGGSREDDENPVQTFKRELKEELNIEIAENQIVPLCDYFNEELKTYRHVFYIRSDLEKYQMQLGEGADFDWIPIKKVFEYNLTEKTTRDLKTFLCKIHNL